MNGILGKIPGDFIAAGSKQLPTPDESQKGEPERRVVVQVKHYGAVRITYLLNSYTHGRGRYWHWLPTHAELVPPPEPPAPL